MPELIGMLYVGAYETDGNVPIPSGAYNYFVFSKTDGLYTIDPDGVVKKIGRDDLVFGYPLEQSYGADIETKRYIMYLATVDGQICWNLDWADGNDGTAIHDNASGEINAITEKTAIHANDLFVLEDSEATNAKKKAKASNIAAYPKGARVYRTTAFTLASSGTLYAIEYDNERWDDNNYHSNVTNNTRLTIAKAGWYYVKTDVQFAANTTGLRDVYIRKNGDTYIVGQRCMVDTSSSRAMEVNCSTAYYFAANDYIETLARQYSGGSLDTVAGTSTTQQMEFTIIGPLNVG